MKDSTVQTGLIPTNEDKIFELECAKKLLEVRLEVGWLAIAVVSSLSATG